MHVKTIGAVSALALFAGVSTAALAQAPGGGAQERVQTPGQSQQMAPGQKQTTQSQERRGEQAQAQEPGQRKGQQEEQPGLRKGQQEEQPGLRKGQQAQEPGERKGQQAQEPGQRKGQQAQEPGQRKGQQAEETERKQERQKAEQPDRKERQKAEQPERKDRQKAEQPETKERMKAEQPERKDRQKAEQPTDRKQAEREGREGRVQLSEQQRTTFRERIREGGALDRARVSSVNFNISVGTRVPRDRVKLVTLPSVIVEEVPAYRGYLYFVVDEQVVIVNPSTYVIVEVIRLDGAPGRAASRDRAGQKEARLSLSAQQRRIVLSHIDMQPGVRLGIGDISIGMDVPQQVELRSFPQTVIQEVPELRSYRYFVFEQEVAIVDPQGRQVVLTISE